jgi:hypothetical protein
MSTKSWQIVLTGRGKPLISLELQCADLTSQQATDKSNHINTQPLKVVDFSCLNRLKIFGDTNHMPLVDEDVLAIASTAIRLEEFYLICNSSITIKSVLAVLDTSNKTLRVLEHSPRSIAGFWHSHPGDLHDSQHICTILLNCTKMERLSISLPSMCADLFSNETVKLTGNLQVRSLHLCRPQGSR